MSDWKPTVIDLFAGVGGLSLGAARAGFDVKLAVELDPHAIKSHSLNFPGSKHYQKDLSLVSGKQLLQVAGLQKVDGIIGGPPCQGFSYMGRRNENDPRNDLYRAFFKLVSQISPDFFVVENVPGILDPRNKVLLESALELVSKKFEIIGPLVMKASDVGAPTSRTRIFFIGVRKKGAYGFITQKQIDLSNNMKTCVESALLGLPEEIDPEWKGSLEHWGKLHSRGTGWFFDKLYGQVPPGVGDERAIQRLDEFDEISGCVGTIHKPEVVERFSTIGPGKKDNVSKATRLCLDGFCPTLRAGTGSDRGSYQAVRPLHPTQHRVITPREAARLQGFPDWFQFHPTKWHSFRQIGNSVSPIVSEALLSHFSPKIHGA